MVLQTSLPVGHCGDDGFDSTGGGRPDEVVERHQAPVATTIGSRFSRNLPSRGGFSEIGRARAPP